MTYPPCELSIRRSWKLEAEGGNHAEMTDRAALAVLQILREEAEPGDLIFLKFRRSNGFPETLRLVVEPGPRLLCPSHPPELIGDTVRRVQAVYGLKSVVHFAATT
ncbi:hypothetical protein [Geothrix sp. PMB-07]|uniref:hypothetical protein n=1 Tax=Geothrix sp. PMB-07 TaxID=3068640 RepID=UPI00274041BC|nr:hypothetical protein [Geothrix sp. PMB-07]WLT33022.1 hypothetical protein Q9293_06755 [Geothrix sp. PMB-07]